MPGFCRPRACVSLINKARDAAGTNKGDEHLQKVRAHVFSSLKSVEPFAVSHSAEQPGLLDTRQDQS